MTTIDPTPPPENTPNIGYSQMRQAFQNIGFKVFKRILQSYNFVTGSAGWRLGANGDFEGNSGTFRGGIVGSSINIPNATSPAFSVDALGNVSANSLRRKDFHWFTVFESIDGYTKSLAGTGSFTGNAGGATSTTGTVSGNENEIQKIVYNAGTQAFSWSKSKSSKYSILIQTDINYHDCKICTGSMQTLTDEHIGFRIINGAVSGSVANGTTESTVSLGSISNNFVYVLEYYHDVSAGSVKFYINGTLYGTLTTNIPSGSAGSSMWLLDWLWKTTTNSSKEMWLSFVDFWQAN